MAVTWLDIRKIQQVKKNPKNSSSRDFVGLIIYRTYYYQVKKMEKSNVILKTESKLDV